MGKVTRQAVLDSAFWLGEDKTLNLKNYAIILKILIQFVLEKNYTTFSFV